MMKKYSRWGRGLLAAGLASLWIVLGLCSCGSDGKEDPSSGASQGRETVSENSHTNEDPASSDPIERLSGRFYIDGDTNAACVEILADGSFIAYYASGTEEQKGTVRYETDDTGEKSFHVYVFYTEEGRPYMGFVDSGEQRISEFETGNGDYRYVRVE